MKIFNEDLFSDIIKDFDNIQPEELDFTDGDYSYRGLVNVDDDRVIITLTREESPSKDLDEFISEIDEDTWSILMDMFEEVTGKPLVIVNKLYDNGDYDKIKELIKLVLKVYIDKLNQLVK